MDNDKYGQEQVAAASYSLHVGAQAAVMECYRLMIVNQQWEAAELLLEHHDQIADAVTVPFQAWATLKRAQA